MKVGIVRLLLDDNAASLSAAVLPGMEWAPVLEFFSSNASSHAGRVKVVQQRPEKEQAMGPIKIRLLGEPAILADGASQTVRGYQAWALLARVTLTPGELDRRTLAAELFPETIDPMGSLRWCLASLRKALDCSGCLAGDPIELNFPDGVEIDVLQLGTDRFEVEQAGRLLGDLEPRCSPEFATWLLIERERIAEVVASEIRQQSMRAIAVENYERAIRLAEIGVRRSVFDERAHVLLVRALALSGKHEAALAHAETTEQTFLKELGVKPTAALRSAARRTVSSSPSSVSSLAFANSLQRSGLAALSAGAVDAGIDCLRQALGEAESAGDRLLQAGILFQLGKALVHSVRGYDDEGAITLRQSCELARQSGSAGIAASALRELGYIEALAGNRPSADKYLSEALDTARGGNVLASIHAVIGFNLVDWGRVDEGLEHFHVALELARAARDSRREIWSLGIGARGLIKTDRLAEAGEWLSTCLRLCESERWIAFRPWPLALLGELGLRHQRDPARLRIDLEEAFATACHLGDPCWEAVTARVMALTFIAEDEYGTAMEWLADGRRRGARTMDAFRAIEVDILESQVDVSVRMGEPVKADAFAREWIALERFSV